MPMTEVARLLSNTENFKKKKRRNKSQKSTQTKRQSKIFISEIYFLSGIVVRTTSIEMIFALKLLLDLLISNHFLSITKQAYVTNKNISMIEKL